MIDDRRLSEPDVHIMHNALMMAVSQADPAAREQLAQLIANGTNSMFERYPPLPENTEHLNKLRSEGVAPLGQVLTKDAAAAVLDYFTHLPCFAAHVAHYSDKIRRPKDETRALSPYGSYLINDAFRRPELLGIALNPKFLALADAYLGALPTLYSINVFWTFADMEGMTHTFHRDFDDVRFLSLFVYLTDVAADNGPIQFIPGSHASPKSRAGMSADQRLPFDGNDYFHNDEFFPPRSKDFNADQLAQLEPIFYAHPQIMSGPAGTAFVMDSYGIHRGTPIFGQDRLVCWIRYGLSPNTAYIEDHIRPVPASDIPGLELPNDGLPWSLRLVVSR